MYGETYIAKRAGDLYENVGEVGQQYPCRTHRAERLTPPAVSGKKELQPPLDRIQDKSDVQDAAIGWYQLGSESLAGLPLDNLCREYRSRAHPSEITALLGGNAAICT